jgi:hypothetical protein
MPDTFDDSIVVCGIASAFRASSMLTVNTLLDSLSSNADRALAKAASC